MPAKTESQATVSAESGSGESGSAAAPSRGPVGHGGLLVIGLVLLGIAAALTGIWYQRGQTGRCLAFFGSEAARRITAAARVELVTLAPTGVAARLAAIDRRDITAAKGLVHLRRGLVEDANFRWPSAPAVEPLPAGAWDVGLVFSDPARPDDPPTTLLIDFDDRGGHAAVVGRPGRIGLGRLEAGLRKWIGSL